MVPEWSSAAYWPILFLQPDRPVAFLKDIIHKSELLIHPGKMGANLFKGLPNTNLLVIQLDF